MHDVPLSYLSRLYRLPVGRRLHCMRKTAELVKDDPKLASRVDACLQHDTALLADRTRFVEQRGQKTTWPARVIQLDQEHDRLLGCIHTVVGGMEGGPHDAPSTFAAARLRRTLFASGLAALTQIDFVQEREQTQAWLTRLFSEFHADVEVLGIRSMLDRLAAVVAEFGQLLDENKPQPTVTYEQIRKAEARGQTLMLQFVNGVCDKHDGEQPGGDAERARLLGPIVEQNEIVRELYRKRAITDVNPDTGEVVSSGGQPLNPASCTAPDTDESPLGGGAAPFTSP